jgi:hypothetical protein
LIPARGCVAHRSRNTWSPYAANLRHVSDTSAIPVKQNSARCAAKRDDGRDGGKGKESVGFARAAVNPPRSSVASVPFVSRA